MKFRIKLLSGNHVILVETDDYDSEIFMPCIYKGRITFMNVIPERRCCDTAAEGCLPPMPGTISQVGSSKKVNQNETNGEARVSRNNGGAIKSRNDVDAENCKGCGGLGSACGGAVGSCGGVGSCMEYGFWGPPGTDGKPICGGSRIVSTGETQPRVGRFCGGVDRRVKRSMPKVFNMNTSTVLGGRNAVVSLKQNSGENSLGNSNATYNSTLPTPDLPRRAAPMREMSIGVQDVFPNPRVVKLRSLQPNWESTPNKKRRPHSSSIGADISRMTDFSGTFGSPSPRRGYSQPDGLVSSTPINKRLNIGDQASPMKWHKVLTPKMTYSRRGNHTVNKHNAFSPSRIIERPPSYLANPTIAPKPTHKVQIKKRRLKVDENIRIPSKVIKKRQIKSETMGKSVSNVDYVKGSINHLSRTPISAFDMLTNSNRTRCISKKLNDQFRRGCVNKASSTHGKYKVLSSVQPLKEDEQVLKLNSEESIIVSVEQTTPKANTEDVPRVYLDRNGTLSTQPLIISKKQSVRNTYQNPKLKQRLR